MATTITSAHCRAARALLNWSQSELAQRASVAERTIIDFENGMRSPRTGTLEKIKAAFMAQRVQFLNDGEPGVRLKRER